jgi:quercetin dioxygenase-like cupin family protein
MRIEMKKSIASVFILWITTAIVSCNSSVERPNPSAAVPNSGSLIFPKGRKITNSNFTGTAYLQPLIESDSVNSNNVGGVTFEPGARSKWHSHPAGQILLAIDGVGYYQEKGHTKKILRKGDVIKCPPNKPHWHGVSIDTAFVQVAITGREKGETVWLDAVSDDEYLKQP